MSVSLDLIMLSSEPLLLCQYYSVEATIEVYLKQGKRLSSVEQKRSLLESRELTLNTTEELKICHNAQVPLGPVN
jgi:hypothetical protein